MGVKLTDINRFSLTYPNLVGEWDAEKNGSLTPEDVSYGSRKMVWWKCKVCGESWLASVSNRTKKIKPSGCCFCSGHKVSDSNSLLVRKPLVAADWDYKKNYPLRPEDVSFGSHKRVWWRCRECGREWKTVINSRPGCLGCLHKSKAIPTDLNRLSIVRPDIAKQWNEVKNGELTSFDVSYASHKKVWWGPCEVCGNTWLASVSSRCRGRGCSYCSGKKIYDKNRLSTRNPELCEEWCFEKNFPLRPENVAFGSHRRVWWECRKCGNIWLASIKNRAINGTGCLPCSGAAVSKMSSEWLDFVGVEEREVVIGLEYSNRSYMVVDGFDKGTNTVYEFLGDYWHGNPAVYCQEDRNRNNGKTFGELFDEAVEKLVVLRSNRYNLNVIWEEDFNKRSWE